MIYNVVLVSAVQQSESVHNPILIAFVGIPNAKFKYYLYIHIYKL